jgi:hypothetical protein
MKGSKRIAAGATVASLAALTALVLVLHVSSFVRPQFRMGLLNTSRHPGGDLGTSDIAIDQQLRADIVRLKVGIDEATKLKEGVDHQGENHGKIRKRTRANLANLAVANVAAARRAQSKASVQGTGDAKMEKEMDAMRRELKSIQDELSDTRHAQRPLIGLAMSTDAKKKSATHAHPCIPGKGNNCLPTVKGKDKKHCLLPLVWARGKCESSPRAAFSHPNPARIESRGRACAGGEDTTSCIEWQRAERQEQQRELNQYEHDLRASSDFQYQPHHHQHHPRDHASGGSGFGG